jgi:hypothetical protein
METFKNGIKIFFKILCVYFIFSLCIHYGRSNEKDKTFIKTTSNYFYQHYKYIKDLGE